MWQSDSSASSCPRCGLEWSIFRPRHHCRACGSCVCGDCSSYFIPMTDPIQKQGIGSLFASSNSGVHRACFSCYHKRCYVAVWDPVIGSLSAKIFPTEEEAHGYVHDTEKALVMHGATAKVLWMSKPHDYALNAKMLERGKGKMRKEMGDDFYQKLEAANAPAPKPPSLLSKFGTFNQQQQQQRLPPQQQQHQGGGAAAAAFAAPPAFAPSSAQQQQQQKLPAFTYCAALCLAGDIKRFRFLQPDIYPNKTALVEEITAFAKEEWAVPASAPDREGFNLEAIVLLDTDWKTVLFVETKSVFSRNATYSDSVANALKTRERFLVCRHEAGRADSTELVLGAGDLHRALSAAAQRGVSAVAVAASGEPVAHSCPDVSVRRELIADRADVEAIKLFHGQSKAAFVATTVPSANSDLRPAESLFDVEMQTAGRLRTTVQAWVFDTAIGDKKCICWPFLPGSSAPMQAPVGVQQLASARLRTAAAVNKGAAPVPQPKPAAAAAAASSSPATSSAPAPASAAAASSQPQPNKMVPRASLAAPPPRPGELQPPAPASPAQPSSPVVSAPECPCCLEPMNNTDRKPLILPCCGNSCCSSCDVALHHPRVCPMCRAPLPDKLVPNRTLINQLS